jgi:SpoIID/LytB domain protein
MVRTGVLAVVSFVLAFAVAFVVTGGIAQADETSATDKLRILYSTRFTFTDGGLPLVTIEIMGHQQRISLHARGGIVVRPDGAGGSSVETDDGEGWTITVEHARPAVIREWTVVEALGPDDAAGISASLARWKQRGLEPHTFEVGTVFGTGGEMIDTREVRIAVAPVAAGKGAARAAELAKRYGIATSVYAELVRRPSGTIVATSGATRIENPSVLWFQPRRAGQTLTVADVPTGTGGSQLHTGHEDRSYWGRIYVTLDHDGSLVAANAVAADRLLAGIVPAEMYPDAPAAALEAQAIAARTDLLQKIGRRNLTDPFLLCSTQQCQVYAGAGKEDPRTTRAVEQTRGIVLLRDGGGLVDVRYSASCGGHTENNEVIWGGAPDPSLRGRADDAEGKASRITDANLAAFLAEDPQDSWCGRAEHAHGSHGHGRFRWTVRLPIGELSRRIAAAYPGLGTIRDLTAKRRGVSGRISVLTITGAHGAVDVTGDLHIRRLLGGLKSTLFAIERAHGAFVLHGAGFGHGVGMCQLGAMGMAEAGKTHAQILAHYYRGTHLHAIY